MTILLAVLSVVGVAGLLLTPVVIRYALRNGIVDIPGERRIHAHKVPRLGGVAVSLATLAGLLAGLGFEISGGRVGADGLLFLAGLLIGGAIVFGVGLADDLRGVRPATKLVAQGIAALAVYHFGFRIEELSLGGDLVVRLGWLAMPLTVLWVVGVTNAFNLIDGLDGLATGIALVTLATTATVALLLGRWEVAFVGAALIGALLGFMIYNVNPARVFLGDSGSLFVGYMLAVLSVHGSIEAATGLLVSVPLFALALPLADTLLSMSRRWLRGVPVSRADRRHIHHQLLELGLTQHRAVLTLYAVALALAVLGLSIAFAPPPLVVWVPALGGALALVLLVAGTRGLRYHEFSEASGAMVSALRTARRVVRDRIHARDVAGVISAARGMAEVDAVLADCADDLHLAHLELCESGAPGPRFLAADVEARRVWKLEYPIRTSPSAAPRRYVLRIWSRIGGSARPHGSERVASILAPALEAWFAAQAALEPAPPPAPARQVIPIAMAATTAAPHDGARHLGGA